ncbi:hypothetical protein BSF42_03680 [Flavobacterium sp. ACN6]|nr:hypothetical protein BSF42_03680 [Flavobacterium sp. ACN6]
MNTRKEEKSPCSTILFVGENDELIFLRSYKGDWGHWDDKIETPPVPDSDPNENTHQIM